MPIRRIVTGRRSGKSVVLSDSRVEGEFETVPGSAHFDLWAVDGTPKAGQAASVLSATVLPPAGGTRFMVVSFPPLPVLMDPDADQQARAQEAAARLRDMMASFEPDNPGMHTTPTLDYGVLLTGALSLELDDGVLVDLEPGDVVVQNGTRHAWRNVGDEPAVMAFVLVGASI